MSHGEIFETRDCSIEPPSTTRHLSHSGSSAGNHGENQIWCAADLILDSSLARIITMSDPKSAIGSSLIRLSEYTWPSINVTTVMPALSSFVNSTSTSRASSRLNRSRLSMIRKLPFGTCPRPTRSRNLPRSPLMRFRPR